jgi:predicted exporter
VQLVDRLGELNQLFAATQLSAAELKLLSCLLIVLLLVLPFGLRGALRIVALPLLAALCSLASLGWLGQPLTLFSLFGLLLVTAISVDYAILMHERIGGAAVSLLGTLLAALTTWLSFGLLALSSTPRSATSAWRSAWAWPSASCWRPGPADRSTPHECDYRQCGKEPSCP